MKNGFLKTLFCLIIFFLLNSCSQFLREGYYVVKLDQKSSPYSSKPKINDKLMQFLEQGELKKANSLLMSNFCKIKANAIIYLPHSLKTKKILYEHYLFAKLRDCRISNYNIIQFSQYISVDDFETWYQSSIHNRLGYKNSINTIHEHFKNRVHVWNETEELYIPYLKKKLNKKLTEKEIFQATLYYLCFINALKGSNLKLAAHLLKKGVIINVKSYYEPGDLSPLSAALSSFDPYKTLLFLKAHGLKKAPLFDQRQSSFLEILNDDSIHIKKITHYFLNPANIKSLRRSHPISRLIQQGKLNIVIALATKKGKRIFNYKILKNLFFNLITLQNEYKYINQNENCKRVIFKKREQCRAKLSEKIDKKYVKHRKLMRYLLKELKISPNIRFRFSQDTPLIVAAKHNNLKTFKLLLRFQAKVNAKNKAGKTALYWAIKNNNPKMVDSLLQKGAKPHSYSKKIPNYLMQSIRQNNTKILKLLLKANAKINVKNSLGQSPLMLAALHNNSEHVKLILEKNAEVNLKDKNGNTALMLTKNYHIVQLLLKAKAKVNLKNKEGKTALSYAVEESDYDRFKLLIDAKADIYVKDNKGNNLLITYLIYPKRSFFNYPYKLTRYLCKHLNVNEKDKNKNTVLMNLLSKKHPNQQLIRALISWGNAEVNLKNKKGKRIVFIYTPFKDKRFGKHRIESYGDIINSLMKSPKLNLDVQEEHGYTPLMILIMCGYNEVIIKKVLHRTKNINLKDKLGKTALDHAYESDLFKTNNYNRKIQKRIIKLLKKHGAKRAAELAQ